MICFPCCVLGLIFVLVVFHARVSRLMSPCLVEIIPRGDEFFYYFSDCRTNLEN